MVMAIGATAPAPRPWMAREAISTGILHAAPQSSEPSRKTAMPISITGLRPTMSESLP